MKKITLLLVIALGVMTGCSSPDYSFFKKDLVVSMKADTSVACQEPIVKDRFACGTGTKLKDPKLVGMKSVNVPISISKKMKISGDSLARLGFFYKGAVVPEADLMKPELTTLWFGKLFEAIIWCLIFLALFYLLFWLLMKFFGHWIPELWNKMKNTNSHTTTTESKTKETTDCCGTIDAIVREMRYNGGKMEVKVEVDRPADKKGQN